MIFDKYDEQSLAVLKQIFPETSEEVLKQNILRGKLEALDEACRVRHDGITMQNYDYNANWPSGRIG